MAVSAHTVSFAQELHDDIARHSALSVGALTFDPADGAPYFLIGAGTAGSQSALIKVISSSVAGTNSLGIANVSYTGSIVQLVMESSATSGVALLTEANKIQIVGPCAFRAPQLDIYLSANGDEPALVEIDPDNLVATFWPNLQYKQMVTQ